MWGFISVILLFISSLSVYLITVLFKKTSASYYFLADSNKILAVALAVALFLFFKNLKIKYNRFINLTAQSIFGVLLIHANSDAMRQWLWKDVLQNVSQFDSKYLVVHASLSVIGVFVICCIIDQIRIRFIEIPFFTKYSGCFDYMQEKMWRNLGE